MLALLLVLLTSGVVNVVVDVVEQARDGAGQTAACGGCPDEEQDCSPVCHDCVCSAGARVLASSGPSLRFHRVPLQVEPAQQPIAAAAFSAPRPPLLSGVFHPPKA